MWKPPQQTSFAEVVAQAIVFVGWVVLAIVYDASRVLGYRLFR